MRIDGIPAAEIDVSASLVRALLAEQHPDLQRLPLIEIGGGWDNTLFRLGDELAVRLPRRAAGAPLIEHEQRWLPELAPVLPLPIPVPVGKGRPGCGFPWAWSIVPWLPGDNATVAPLHDVTRAALDLGAFSAALHQPAPDDAPVNPFRGVPLADRTNLVRDRAARLDGVVDAVRVLAVWDDVVLTPPWSGKPVWIHGDLHPGNLLVHEGRLSAVIDFGDLTSGDPATDLAVAWMLLPPQARQIFRKAAGGADGVDDDTWVRARGWALTFGLIFLASSRDSEMMTAMGQATIDAVLADPPA
jgi:aminoglycoside phosphotransferase (APT) family kinase protein